MNTRVICVLLGVAMTGAAAVSGSPAFAEQYVQPDTRDSQRIVHYDPMPEPTSTPSRAYTNRRWIGLLKKGLSECPPSAGWTVSPLRSRQYDEDRKLLKESGLDRFCIYTKKDASTPPLEPLPPGLVKAARDRMDLSAMATHVPPMGALGDPSWQILADRFLDQSGQARLARTATPQVRLVFVDSHPTGEWPPPPPLADRSWHGFTMAHLAHRIVCGDTGSYCPIEIATCLALRYDDYDPDMPIPLPELATEGGGNLGLVSDLAIAILDEVRRWEKSGAKTKLVLNLSVGWDGELHDAENVEKSADLKASKESKLEPSVLAVYKALRYASRRGVLVIAAAGNRRGGRPATHWPVLPAAWELRRPTWVPFGLGCKPLYAVGGIDWQGLPLANSRHRGLPRRAAYADHAIARIGEPAATAAGRDESTLMFTGTSVSAAVTSSIAAVLWDLRPELQPAGVMRLMGRAADVLESRADFYAWRPLSPVIGPPRVRRLSLCRSVLAACGADGSRCSALDSVDCRLGRYAPADLSFISLPQVTTSFEPPNPPPLPCDPATGLRTATATALRIRAGTASAAEDFCPLELLSGRTPADWVGPQPEENPCPNCTIVPEPPRRFVSLSPALSDSQGYALLAQIDPNWPTTSGTNIISAVLALRCYTDGEAPQLISFDLSRDLPSILSSSSKVLLGPIAGRDSLAGCTASVDFRVRATATGAPRSVQSPVYVDP